MSSSPSTDFSGLSCSTQTLGTASGIISQYVRAATWDAVSQLCDHPSDSMYHINSDSVSVSFDGDVIDLTITMPSDAVAQGSVACESAFNHIARECFTGEEVWGGDFYDGDFTYSIAKADSADSMVAYLENIGYGQASGVPASGIETATVEASGVASGFPVQSGIASGCTEDENLFPTPTATAVASGFPVESGFVPSFIPVIPSGYPVESGVVPSGVESGYIAIPTPEAPVFPGRSEYNALGKVRRGSGDREEVEAGKRPQARWIMG